MSDHIVIGDIRPRIQYTADGVQTDFTYPFPIFAAGDLKVYLGDALQAGGYTVSGAGQSAGGLASFAAAPAAGTKVTLLRALAVARNSDFQEGGAFRAKTINDELDRQTAFVQEVGERIERALVAGPTESAAPLVLPPPAARANALLGFDAAGAPLAVSGSAGGVVVSTAMTPLVQAADAAAARAALGLGSAALADTGTGNGQLPFGNATRLSRLAETVKTVDYAIVAADAGAMLIANKASAIAFTLPAAAALGLGFAFMARNIGAGNLTLDPNAAETINAAATLVLKQHEAAMVWTDGILWRANVWGVGSRPYFALIQDEKSDGTPGGGSIASAWTKRDINTKKFDANSIVSLASNQFTLGAGEYSVFVQSPFLSNANIVARVRLFNATDGSVVSMSPSSSIGTTTGVASNFVISCHAYLHLTDSKSFAIEYYVSAARATDGLGIHDGLSLGAEIYTQVSITKLI